MSSSLTATASPIAGIPDADFKRQAKFPAPQEVESYESNRCRRPGCQQDLEDQLEFGLAHVRLPFCFRLLTERED